MRIDIDFLVIGKRMGLSFSELNELRVEDLLDMAGVFSGSEGDRGPREATQADIDAFYGR